MNIGDTVYFVTYDHVIYEGVVLFYVEDEQCFCVRLADGERMFPSVVFPNFVRAWGYRRDTLEANLKHCQKEIQSIEQKRDLLTRKLREWDNVVEFYTTKQPYDPGVGVCDE